MHYLSKAERGREGGGGGEFAYFNLIFVAISRCQGFEDFIPPDGLPRETATRAEKFMIERIKSFDFAVRVLPTWQTVGILMLWITGEIRPRFLFVFKPRKTIEIHALASTTIFRTCLP